MAQETLEQRQKRHGVDTGDVGLLINTLTVLINQEGPLKSVLTEAFGDDRAHSQVCHALRQLTEED